MGSTALASQFPTLFGCASDKSALVGDYLSSSVGQTVRGPICRRNLLSGGDRYIPDEGVDRRVWEGSVDGSFLVASFFSSFVGVSSVSFHFEGI